MKKQAKKKLVLAKETVRNLEELGLEGVVGADSATSCLTVHPVCRNQPTTNPYCTVE